MAASVVIAAPTTAELAATAVLANGLYGGRAVEDGAAAWAHERGLRLSGGYWRCAHGLLRRGRRWPCGCEFLRVLDHPSLWVRSGRPVVLMAHLYDLDAGAVHAYADQHGLTVTIGDPADAWYPTATPVRFEVAP